MRVYAVDQLRNIALIGHGQAGKTSLVEAMLFAVGATERLGSVEAGNTISDSDPEEAERQVSISLSLQPVEWAKSKINLLDTPGYADFAGEVASALQVVDGVVAVVDAASGVGVQTERYWAMAVAKKLPRVVAVTKLDKEHTDFARTLADVGQRLECNAVAVSLPIGSQTGLKGVVDLVRGCAYLASAGKESRADIPDDMADAVAEYRGKLMEAAAEADDSLMEKYIEEEQLSPDEIVTGLRAATIAGKIVPVGVTASTQMVGIQALMDTIVANLPDPAGEPVVGEDPRTGEEATRERSADAPLSALVFKTTTDPYAGRLSIFRVYSGVMHSDSSVYNANRGTRERIGPLLVPAAKRQDGVPSIAVGDMGLVAKLHVTLTGETLCDESAPIQLPGVEFPESVFSRSMLAKSRADEDKVGSALARLTEEDPTLRYSLNAETKETILSGMGDLHLDIAVSKLQRKFGVEVQTGTPKIPYRETIRKAVRVQGRHKKQTGGRGQFGAVWVQSEPLPRGSGFEFVDAVKGGSVPRNYIAAVEKGLREACSRGLLAGCPVIDIRCTLDDGSSHAVDSSDMAFKIAGSLALHNALEEAGSILLEPIVAAEVVVPAEQMGEVIGALNGKRGNILGMEPKGDLQLVRAIVPLAEMSNYASELRSITGGRGSYTMQFAHYQEVPPHLTQAIIDAAKQEKEG